MIKSSQNLNMFIQHVQNAKTNYHSERIVRLMLENISQDCPIDLLVEISDIIIKYRKKELLDEISLN